MFYMTASGMLTSLGYPISTSLVALDVGGFDINAGLNDAWFNSDTAGQGFLVSVFPVIEQVFVAWFTYDTERPAGGVMANLGEPGHRWLTAQGPYTGDTATLNIFLTEGGVFDQAAPAPSTGAPIGTMVIVWHSCEMGTLTYNIPSLGLMGSIEITRIVADNIILCEELNAPPG